MSAPVMQAATCGNCRWFDQEPRQELIGDDTVMAFGYGLCRFAPPTVIPNGGDLLDYASVYPITSRNDFCGQWCSKAATQ